MNWQTCLLAALVFAAVAAVVVSQVRRHKKGGCSCGGCAGCCGCHEKPGSRP